MRVQPLVASLALLLAACPRDPAPDKPQPHPPAPSPASWRGGASQAGPLSTEPERDSAAPSAHVRGEGGGGEGGGAQGAGAAGAGGEAGASGAGAPGAACKDLVEVGDAKLSATPAGFTVRGVDASTPGAWATLKRQGVEFTLHQVALGTNVNKDFAANWRTAKACGLPRGAYHFLTPKADGGAQARMFLQQLGDDRGELLPIVDVELPPGCKGPCCAVSCDDWSGVTAAWLAEVEKALGRKVGVYTVAEFWKECLCNTSRFALRPLWLAGYPTFDLGLRPGFGGWQRWVFYQYKGNFRLGQAVLDLNVFRDDHSAFEALLAASKAPPSP